jgi:GAF domain-containing protein
MRKKHILVDPGGVAKMTIPDPTPEGPLAEELRRLVQALEASGRALLPGSAEALLRAIVEAAAKIFRAAAASILLVNESEGVLEFKVAYGASNRDLVGTRIPLDQGIAGYVAMTGQPLAISNVEHDARFQRDFAKSTGYIPASILAMPLTSGEKVLGVMEVLDKIDAPAFGMQDMELLGLFAQQAALAIAQAQTIEHLGEALTLSLKRLASSNTEHPPKSLFAALEADAEPSARRDLLEVADLLYAFSDLGENERKTCLKILSAFSEYAHKQSRSGRGAYRR